MANSGAGTKFVSVNWNKSYGQHAHHHQTNSYSRTRPSNHGGSGGGGMVVLSRPRSSQKSGPKLSVPPPLNLPSLRREHEKFDSLGTSSGAGGGGVSGSGMRPGSSGMGWTKPVAVGLPEKDVPGFSDKCASGAVDQDMHSSADGLSKGGSVYMPPSARSGPMVSAYTPVEKVSVLRGEDFPSLQAAVPATSGTLQRQKDGSNVKRNQFSGEDTGDEQRSSTHVSSVVDMCPQVQSSRHSSAVGVHENGNGSAPFGSSQTSGQSRKQDDYFSGPLPLVQLNPRSDWADDERDTGHGLTEQGRDNVFSKSEAYWEGDFEMRKASFLPHKPGQNSLDRWGQRDNEAGKFSSSEVHKADAFDVRVTTKESGEGSPWRTASPVQKQGISIQESRNDRNNPGVRSPILSRETKDNKYTPSSFGDSLHEVHGRKDLSNGLGGKPSWNSSSDSFNNRGIERNARDQNGSERHTKYSGDDLQSGSALKVSLGGKGLPVNDPFLNFTREKHPLSKSEKPYLEDPFLKDFGDGRGSLPGSLLGVVKRKKDMLKRSDFYDPVRESFEAELERVQKMQEQERQRIIEEQERALELTRREEEERARQMREHEERKRRLEEEAREAAWRAEQERLEVLQKAEEQRLSREEEKRRIFMEEERRKQAAKQKLLELEERIAKRQAEVVRVGSNASTADDRHAGLLKEKFTPGVADMGDWEDGEKMVERITTPVDTDTSNFNKAFDVGCRQNFSRDNSILVGGKPSNTWRRETFEMGSSSTLGLPEQDSGQSGPRHDASYEGRALPRKEFYGGVGYMSSRSYHKGGISEPPIDDFPQMRGQRWNLVDGDHLSRNPEVDSEFRENIVETFGGDAGWGQSRPHANPYSPYTEQFYQSSESDGSYPFGRSRFSMRQPRVLPPPSLASMHRNSNRGKIERPGPSNFLDNEMPQTSDARSEPTIKNHQDNIEHGSVEIMQESTEEQKLDQKNAPRCDSQSSLSVSSPPDSPIHLSHDDMDESGDYPVEAATVPEGDFLMPENEAAVLRAKAGQEIIDASSSGSSEEEGEWMLENNQLVQEQEEYDEDEEGYQEEDEVREGDDENVDRHQEFDDLHLENGSSSGLVDNLVLGFNEGVEVPVPSDEFERSSRNDRVSPSVPSASLGGSQEEESSIRLSGDVQNEQHNDGSQSSIDASSRLLHQTEKAMQDLVIKPNSAAATSAASHTLECLDTSGGHAVPSVASRVLHSTAPGVATQAETPMKLQFGLFSGPSLIPTPLPAIQIGSIQMPLHLHPHPQVGPSLNPMQQAQPPIFQFGQLRYPSPIPPGIVPVPPHSVSFVQPNVQANFPLSQNPNGSLSVQQSQDISSQNFVKMEISSHQTVNQPGLTSRHFILSEGNTSESLDQSATREKTESILTVRRGQAEQSQHVESNTPPVSTVYKQELHNEVAQDYKSMPSSKKWEGQGVASSQSVRKEKDLNGPKVHGSMNGSKSKHYVFKVKNPASRSFLSDNEFSQSDVAGYQRRHRRHIRRTEFRVRDNVEKKQSATLGSSTDIGPDDKSNLVGRSTMISGRAGSGKSVPSNKQTKQTFESESIRSAPMSTQEGEYGSRDKRQYLKESISRSQGIHQAHSVEQIPKSNFHEEDIDAPLQSGVVRVFEQPGIEAPSDEDDFIEVRSKRQMLNDKREQREKEIKAKSRIPKVPRKPRPLANTVVSSSLKRISSRSGEILSSANVESGTTDGCSLANVEVSAGFSTSFVSQPLAPIGTPAAKTEARVDSVPLKIMSLESSSLPADMEENLGSSLVFESKSKALDNGQPLDSWVNSGINQQRGHMIQVMTLTQSQLDEAMKPAKFDARASVGEPTFTHGEVSMPLASTSTKDKSFSSATSPITSLLAGEKIQFGAVTSPTVLPHSGHALSHEIGSCIPDGPVSCELSATANNCTLFFDKENSGEPCIHLEDSEAEAEAAASAVAVAAISSDEMVGNGLDTCSISVSDTKTFGSADVDVIPAGASVDRQSANHSRTEEPLNVSLPADLSVETPMSPWQPLTSSQSNSSHMLSHFPGGPHSHFPFYEMNPMMGSPIFAFGPNEETASTQPQLQKSTAASSRPHGSWPQCHSGVDSFYGPHAGFTGPFISAGGIPGVQGPPHMVVYNHFAPVGQFGQVGLSFMGTTFIPSGRQPDWKHNPTSSPIVGEGDVNNINVISAQRDSTNMPAQIQHLAPGSPLLPMPSPIFDVSPFQSSPEASIHTHWSHLPASPLQSSSVSMPVQQQAGVLPAQFNIGPSVDQSLATNRFAETRTSTPDSNRNFPVATDATDNQFPDALGLLDPSSSSTGASTQSVVAKSSSLNASTNTSNSDLQTDCEGCSSVTVAVKNQASQQKSISQNYGNSGYTYQRGGASQKGAEWPHRRTGFQGRSHSVVSDKGFSSSKVKQIYVAKQAMSGKPATS